MPDRTGEGRHRRWLGYHLFPEPPVEPYLVHHLAPLLRRALDDGTLRRAFFIRYGAGADAHLRLRVLPHVGRSSDQLRRVLQSTVAAHVARVGDQVGDQAGTERQPPRRAVVEEHPYRRAEHYFGETRSSVYAELLNEATSWLALDVLGALDHRRRWERWLVAAALTERLLQSATGGGAAYRTALGASESFAATACRRFGVQPADRSAAVVTSRAAAVESARATVETAFRRHQPASNAARLIRRMGAMGNEHVTVATHGLHLLWNKFGFSLAEELAAYEALLRLEAPVHPGPGHSTRSATSSRPVEGAP